MARQYDVEDLLNSDASDPDGEAIPVATNDEVQEGKIIVETAAGTGKIGNVSQIVADYLQKSAGFYTEVRPYYIVRPAPGDAWTGTWQLFLHGLDDGGLSDATNITIGINGVVVHTAPWTASAGERDIAFSISEAESTALIATPPTGSNVRCYVAFHDSEGNEIVIRHFTLKLLAAVPKIPEDEIPDSIARDDEVTEAINKKLSKLSPVVRITPHERRRSELAGLYNISVYNLDVIFPDVDQIRIYFHEASVIDTGINSSYKGQTFAVVDLVADDIRSRTANNAEEWVVRTQFLKDDVVRYTVDNNVQVDVTEPPSTAIEENKRRIEGLDDKTADMRVHSEPGDFENASDPKIAAIGSYLKSAANEQAIHNGSFDFTAVTYAVPTIGIPSDATGVFGIIVRTSKSLGHAESQFRVYELETGESLNYPLRQQIGEDDGFFYYSTVDARAGDAWYVQYRGTHPHNTFHGNLGETPLEDVDKRVANSEIGKKTTDLKITELAGVFGDNKDIDTAAIALVERTTANDQAITDNTLDWGTQTYHTSNIEHTDDSKRYYLVFRLAKSAGDMSSQFKITSDVSSLVLAITTADNSDATYNYYIITTIDQTVAITLQRQGQEDKTRFDGELGGKALEQVGSGGGGSGASSQTIKNLESKTADLHVEETQPPFANLTDAAIGGIAVDAANATSRAAVKAGTYDFSALTFANPSATIPRDAISNYFVFVRVAKSLGSVEPRFRVYNEGFGDGVNFPLGELVGSDATWNYYTPTEGGPSDKWIVQYRETHSHTRFDGELGNPGLAQVDEQITENPAVESLQDKTSDIHINKPPGDFSNLTNSAIGGVAALLETPQVLSALSAGTYDFSGLTFANPSVSYSPTRGQKYQVIVRVAKTHFETQLRVLLKHAVGDTQRYYSIGDSIGSDTTWNYYSAVTGELAATATVEYRETHTHTRYEGEIGKVALAQVQAIIPSGGPGGTELTSAQIALINLLLENLPAEGQRNRKFPIFVENAIQWIVNPDNAQAVKDLADRLSTDEAKLENFIQTVNNYFDGHGEGDVTAQEIAHLFALLDEYNPEIDEIRSTLGLVGELGEPTRLVQEYADQTTFLSNANVPSTLPKIEYKTQIIGAVDDADAIVVAVNGESANINYTSLAGININISGANIVDPFLRYYLNGDTGDSDAIQDCGFFIYDNRLYILLSKHEGGGTDPLAAFTSATLRPYISYAALDDLAADGTITKHAVETLAPTNADHDVSFIPSFATELPDRRLRIKTRDARGWYFNNTDSGITFNSILAKWYSDLRWLTRMYEYFRLAVENAEQVGGDDPREKNWIDGSKNPLDAGASVVRPPYASLDALKSAFPIPDLNFYFKLSVDGMVMNLADHDIHRPQRNKLVQIPDTHYNTPPRVSFLPTIARENEVFQLVGDQYRPDSDHTWTFKPLKETVNNRTVAGASIPTVLRVTHTKIGVTSDTEQNLPDIFQRSALNAIVAFADDPEHLHLYINSQRVSINDILTVELHGLRANGSPIVRTATFRFAETFSISATSIRRFQSRVSGAYGIMDLSETLSISIKRGNTYLYLNPANTPPTPEWETGLLHTAGLYKGLVDGSFVKAEFPTLDTWNHVVARSNTFFSGTGPDAARGVDNQFWVNLRTGQIYQKQSGTWTQITDVALQTEISRAIEWSTIPNNTSIPANFMTKHSNRYFGAKLQHVKTGTSTAPTGDTTNWIELSNEVATGTSAVAVEWESLPRNSSIAIGTIVKHGRYAYLCITAHNKVATGPDADFANWQLLANYQGAWAVGYYHSGAIVVHGTGVYLAIHTVLNTDPAPNAATNTKWLQINNTEPPVRYIELTVNTGLSVAGENAAAVPLTYASTLAKSNENTGVLTRNSAGNAIDLVAGTYTIDTHIVIDPGNNDKRANFTIQIYEGSNLLDEKTYLAYSRARPALAFESVSSRHIFTLSASRTIQVRIKFADRETGASASTAAGGTVTVKKE